MTLRTASVPDSRAGDIHEEQVEQIISSLRCSHLPTHRVPSAAHPGLVFLQVQGCLCWALCPSTARSVCKQMRVQTPQLVQNLELLQAEHSHPEQGEWDGALGLALLSPLI